MGASSKAGLTRSELQQLVADNYSAISLGLLSPLLDVLGLSRQACGGDMDKFLIMLMVAIRTTAHKDFASYTPDQLLSGAVPVFPSLGLNIASIAGSLGAPKETIRRKVVELVEAGWIERQGNNLCFTAAAYRDFVDVRDRIGKMAVRHHEVVEALLEGRTAG